MVALSATFMCAVSAHAEIPDQQMDQSPSAEASTKSVDAKTINNKSSVETTVPASQGQPSQGAVAKKTPLKTKPKPAVPRLTATINLSNQTLTVSTGGQVRHVWKISSGRRGYRTPTGTYRPQWLERMHYSRKYDNAPMPHSVFFHRGFAIHATYATRRLGSPASHGCIRLSPSAAKKFYYLVQKYGKANTRISIHGVAVDRRYYAKRKKRARVKYASTYSWSGWGATAYQQPKRRHRAQKRAYAKPYKKARRKKKAFSVSYAQQKYAWPGD